MERSIWVATFDSIFIRQQNQDHQDNDFQTVSRWMMPKSLLTPPNDHELAAFASDNLDYEELMSTYINQTRDHFFTYARTTLETLIYSQPFGKDEVTRLLNVLGDLHRHYYYPFQFLRISHSQFTRFQLALKALLYTVVTPEIFKTIVEASLESHNLCLPNDLIHPTLNALRTLQADDSLDKLIFTKFLTDFKQLEISKIENQWEASVIGELETWLTDEIIPTAQTVVPEYSDSVAAILQKYSIEILAEQRTKELFDIVVDFPDSKAGLEDLKYSITSSKQRAAIVNQFQKSCILRLLHGGANTVDILYGYISAIKCFGILDPRGVLLERISKPIRKYLKEREDTVSELVSGILGYESSSIKDLGEELISARSSDDVGMKPTNDLNWHPDPIDAPLDFSTDNGFDIIGNLISMFDSKDAIIKELIRRFAEKMLNPTDAMSEEIVCLLY